MLYIDDLDRCPEKRVVDVLQAVHMLLALPLFVVVVGVDSRWLLHSLRLHSRVFQAQPGQIDGFSEEERVHWQSTPMNYLEKIFQIPYAMRPMQPSGFKALIDDLTAAPPETATPRAGGRVSPSPATSRDGSVDGVELATPEHEPATAAARPESRPGRRRAGRRRRVRSNEWRKRPRCARWRPRSWNGVRGGLPLAHRNPAFRRLERGNRVS